MLKMHKKYLKALEKYDEIEDEDSSDKINVRQKVRGKFEIKSISHLTFWFSLNFCVPKTVKYETSDQTCSK